tara:strand:- start:37998 stop:43232 length:5235 start_codon:yes stop_codon:yes gene_type:complete
MSLKPKVENIKQNIYLVDPNPPGMEIHNSEDLFIYVKLSAFDRNRSNTSGTSGEINFIATQVDYDAEGEIIKNNDGKQKTYATTDYTRIGGTQPSDSRGILEGFGIKSIDIKYNASLVPQVDIKFTDTRGAALFDVITADNKKSPYSIFFKMPYPVFQLSIKGYYGKTVDYCLHMLNWTSNFDGSTGNFDISANFVGFQQAFLNDMLIGNIIGTVNTPEGFANLNGIFNEELEANPLLPPIGSDGQLNDEKLDIRKLDDFFIQISKLQIEFQDIKSRDSGIAKLKVLNEQINKLKRIQTFVGPPIRKTKSKKEDSSNKEYEEIPNDVEQINTASINDNALSYGSDYLSIRDFLIVNAIRLGDIDDYFNTLKDISLDYQQFVEENKEKLDGGLDKTSQEDLILALNITTTTEKPFTNFIYSNGIDLNKNKTINLKDLFTTFAVSGGILNRGYGDTPNSNSDSTINQEFSPKIFADAGPNGRITLLEKNGLGLDNDVFVFDLRVTRAKIQNTLKKLDEIKKDRIKEVYDKLNKELEKKLKFKPTIRNVFRIICNNTEAMLQTLLDVSNNADSEEKYSNRKRFLVDNNLETDIPQSIKKVFAWPRFFRISDSEGSQEIYIGEAEIQTNIKSYPEYKFVEDVYTNLVNRRKELSTIGSSVQRIKKAGFDTDNWFPINVLDYSDNPFMLLNSLNTQKELIENFSEQVFKRVLVAKKYSNYDLSFIASLDGINANKTIFNKEIRQMLINKNASNDEIIKTIKNLPITDLTGNTISINQPFGLGTATNYLFGNKGDSNADKVKPLILNNSKITNNSKLLWKEISDDEKYKKKVSYEELKNDYKIYYYNNNLTYNLFNYAYIKPITDKIVKNSNKNSIYKIKDITEIDISATTAPDGIYVNKINTKEPNLKLMPTDYYMTDWLWYQQQGKTERAYLLLSTLPFRKFKDVKDIFTSQNVKTGILQLPKYYTYFIGALLWRAESTNPTPLNDVTNWKYVSGSTTADYSKLYSDFNKYLKIGTTTANSGLKEITIDQSLLNIIPTSIKKTLIDNFTTWAENVTGFEKFENLIKKYKSINKADLYTSTTPQEVANEMAQTDNRVVSEFEKLDKWILTDTNLFVSVNNTNESISESDINTYLDVFKTKFKITEKNNTNGESTDAEKLKEKSNKTENAIKLKIYQYFKNINDKWVSDPDTYTNLCNNNRNLIEYFKFIDRGWDDIGDKAIINLSTLNSLSQNLDTSIYFFISKILRDNNFLFQILPTYINYKDPVEVEEMFLPIPNVSEKNRSGGPAYVCIFAGGNSEVLDIGDSNQYTFANDGYSFKNPPKDVNGGKDNALVAFRVAFGAENQSIFKNVSLSQQEHKQTGEYFKVLSDVIDKRGGTQRSYQGTDLLELFKTRSYTCNIEALGCMNIQPLMYFDLQNVPFFNGAYMITGVNHSISPNTMSTSFTGVRQSKFVTSYVEEGTAFLNIDENEDLGIEPVEFTNLLSSSPIYTIGIREEVENEPHATVTVSNLTNLGVDETIATPFLVSQLNSTLNRFNITTNSQFTMFMANILTNSDNFKNILKPYNIPPEELENSIVKFDNSSPFSGKTKYYDVTTVLSGQPYTQYVTGGTPNDIVYNPTILSDNGGNLGNTQLGDNYRFRERGYLYINGKNDYIALTGTSENFFLKPYSLETMENSMLIAGYVWNGKNAKNKLEGANKTSKESGIATVLTKTTEEMGTDLEKTIIMWEKVLKEFASTKDKQPLIDYERG